MNCINCGAQLSTTSDICEYCGTVNDTDLISRRTVGVSEAQIDEAHSYGTGQIDEGEKEEADRKRMEGIKYSRAVYSKSNKKRLLIFSVIFMVLMYFAFQYLIGPYVIGEIVYFNELASGRTSLDAGFYKIAIEKFEKVARHTGRNPLPHYLIALSYYYSYIEAPEQKKLEEMKKNLLIATRYKKNYHQAHYFLGVYYFTVSENGKASEEFTKCNEYARDKVNKSKYAKDWQMASEAYLKQIAGEEFNKKYKDPLSGVMPFVIDKDYR